MTDGGCGTDPAAVGAGDAGDGEDVLVSAVAMTSDAGDVSNVDTGGGCSSEAASCGDAVDSTGTSAAVTGGGNGNLVAVSGAGGQLSIALGLG